jgi:hypothetical protein
MFYSFEGLYFVILEDLKGLPTICINVLSYVRFSCNIHDNVYNSLPVSYYVLPLYLMHGHRAHISPM